MTTKSGAYARFEPAALAGVRARRVGEKGELSAAFAGVSSIERIEIDLLLEGIYRHYGHDFRGYAFSSLRRRLRKRLEGEGLATFSELQGLVLHDHDAMDRLIRDMSVNVTGMFRDPSFFLALREQIVPILRTYPFVRIWHAGCASGEEAYALAILLEEEGLYERSRIYATDMNAGALERAKVGAYPLARMREYTSNYLQAGGSRSFSEYYAASAEVAVFDARLRRNVLFAQHNLATDTSFSEFNLILCRNVMIYFDRALKTRVFGLFRDSLASLGILALGRRESLRFTSAEAEYEEFDAKERIYRRIG